MDLYLLHAAFSWLAHVDPGCIVCNWDPELGWVPWAAGGVGAAAGASLGLSDLFGPEVGGTAIGDTSIGGNTGRNDREGADETDLPGGNEPLDPHTLPPVNQFSSTEDIERRVAAEERERRRLRDLYRTQHPDATTAGPPPPPTTTGDPVVDTFFEVVREIDW